MFAGASLDENSGAFCELKANFFRLILTKAEELGIPTPYNEYTYHMIKALEEKNDGLFDYQGERDKTTWAK